MAPNLSPPADVTLIVERGRDARIRIVGKTRKGRNWLKKNAILDQDEVGICLTCQAEYQEEWEQKMHREGLTVEVK